MICMSQATSAQESRQTHSVSDAYLPTMQVVQVGSKTTALEQCDLKGVNAL